MLVWRLAIGCVVAASSVACAAAPPARSKRVGHLAELPAAPPDVSPENARLVEQGVGAQRVEVEWRLRAMQKALWRDDRSGFAEALIYPVFVNTGSGCSAVVESEATFLAHYAEIVAWPIRDAVLRSKGDWGFMRDAWSVADDSVWFPVGMRGFVFNSRVWQIPLLPSRRGPLLDQMERVSPDDSFGLSPRRAGLGA